MLYCSWATSITCMVATVSGRSSAFVLQPLCMALIQDRTGSCRRLCFEVPDLARRRDGSYIIEEFLTTGGTDVKVYTVGPRYAHAEARKSPVVDGKVTRSADGKELRFPVLLSPQARRICTQVSGGSRVCFYHRPCHGLRLGNRASPLMARLCAVPMA